jgi:hypothetical protein
MVVKRIHRGTQRRAMALLDVVRQLIRQRGLSGRVNAIHADSQRMRRGDRAQSIGQGGEQLWTGESLFCHWEAPRSR